MTHAPRRLVVEAEAAGARLDTWLARAAADLSRARVQALIAEGHVRVEGALPRPSTRLRAGQAVELTVPPPRPAEPQPEALALRIVHEDEDFLVVDKPAGLVVHPGAGSPTGTLVNALLHHARSLSGIGGVLRPGIVHRLDKGTSGLLVVAKNDEAHRSLQAQFAGRTVEKEYLALVLGTPRVLQGRVDAPIGRDPKDRKKMSVRASRGREARTSWEVAEAFDGAALLKVRIQTGRTHQIRVHLASVGHPVAGDAAYGGLREPGSRSPAARAVLRSLSRPALHAARLAFTHPRRGERLIFEAPLPDDLSQVLDRLRAESR